MFIFTLEDIIGLSLIGLFALGFLVFKIESVIQNYQRKKKAKKEPLQR